MALNDPLNLLWNS